MCVERSTAEGEGQQRQVHREDSVAGRGEKVAGVCDNLPTGDDAVNVGHGGESACHQQLCGHGE